MLLVLPFLTSLFSKMTSMVDEMFARLRECANEKYARRDWPDAVPAYWLSVWDEAGFACSRVEGVRALGALSRGYGVIACASLTYFRPDAVSEAVVAYVVSRTPDDSDVRQAPVTRKDNGFLLGDWSRLV